MKRIVCDPAACRFAMCAFTIASPEILLGHKRPHRRAAYSVGMRIALALVLVASTAWAEDKKTVSLHVTATATSEKPKYEAWRAIGQITAERLGWCTAKPDGTGEAITFAFDEPQPLTALHIETGHEPDWGKGDREFSLADKVEIKTDKQTLQATLARTSNVDGNNITLSGAPTRSVTVKILSVKPGKVAQTCINSVHFDAPKINYRPVYGFDRSAWQSFPEFAKSLDAAFKSCDASALGRYVTYPIVHDHETIVPDSAPGVGTKTVKYKSAADLAKACARTNSPLQLGLVGEDDGTIDGEIADAFSDRSGIVRLGDWNTHAWWITWDHGWHLTKMLTSTSVTDDPIEAIKQVAGTEIDAWSHHNTEPRLVFTDDAKIVVVQKDHGLVDAAKAGDVLGLSKVAKHDESNVAVTLARDHHSAVLSFVTKADGKTYRVSELVVREQGAWSVAAGMWSEPKANDAVNKAASAGSIAIVPIAPGSHVDMNALSDGFFAMQKGAIDKLVSPDLIVFGSGPGERTVGGAKFAKPWAATWANHVPLASGVVSKLAPTGTTGWWAADINLEKHNPKLYLVPFRLFLVFDKALDGTFILIHAHIATVAP